MYLSVAYMYMVAESLIYFFCRPVWQPDDCGFLILFLPSISGVAL